MHTVYHRRVHSPTGKPVVLCLRPQIEQGKQPNIRNTSMDITVETCGQFQEVNYEEITTSLDARNIKSLPIDKDKNQWK